MADYSISTVITADSTEFEKNIKKAGKSVKVFSAELQTVTKALGALFVGRQILDFGKKSVKLLEQERKETALLNKTLQITGASAWETQDALVSMAQELEKNSNYSQEQIMRAQTVMLGFKSVTGEVFDSAIQNVIDMSEVMGIDLVNSVQTIGKALDDPIKGLGSLSRQGFVFSEQQKEMLANMVAVGDKAGAQKIILDELTTTYGGAGKAGQNAFQKLNVAVGNFQKVLASNLIPTITTVTESLTGLLEGFNALDKGTQSFILTASGLVTTLPLIIKGIKGLKVALVSLQASVPILLAISAGIVAISAVVGKISKMRNELGDLSKEIKAIEGTTGSYLDTYAQGNEAKILDEEATKRLIELYPELTGKITAYSDSVGDARDKVQELVNKKLLDAESTGIQDYIQQLNKIQKLREKATKYESTRNEMDRARAVEILNKEIPAVVKLAETQRQAINERLKGIGKMIAYDGKVVNIPVEVKPQIAEVTTETKKRWQKVLAEVLAIDESSFETDKQAVDVYVKSISEQIKSDETISNALAEAFDIQDVLKTQQENIKKSINEILDSVNVDSPFSVEDFEKQNSALSQLAQKYKELGDKIKGIEINKEIAKLEKEVANLGKSELELYEAELKANGATDEQIERALELKKTLLGTGDTAKNTASIFEKEWGNITEKLKADAEDWSDVTNSITDGINNVTTSAIEDIGASLVEGEGAWEDYGAMALKAIAKILEALAMQLSALAVANIASYNYGKAAVATAGAVTALAGAGALKSLSNSMTKVASATASATASLEDFKNTLDSIWSDKGSTSSFLLAFRQSQKIIESQADLVDELQVKYIQATKEYDAYIKKWGQKLINGQYAVVRTETWYKLKTAYESSLNDLRTARKNLAEAYKAQETALQEEAENIKAQNTLLKETIDLYEVMYEISDVYFSDFSSNWDFLIAEQEKNILSLTEDLYGSLSETGQNIGETLIDNIIDGATKEDFAESLRDYIRKNMIKLTILTDEFSEELAEISVQLNRAMLSGSESQITEIKQELDSLYEESLTEAEKVNSIISSVFGDITETVTEDAESGLNEINDYLENLQALIGDFEEEVGGIGTDIANSLISGIEEGLTNSDFIDNMYTYIRKLIIQTVVYTESMQAEIARIGQTISDSLTTGFSENTLQEVRRDLSYIFYSANQQMAGIDSVLESVFSGYASGTENATRGLHLVGEAGPELVAFNGGEKVYNAEETSRMLNGGNNFNVTFNNTQDTTAFAMMQQLRQYNREMAINGIF